ncbi:MAG: glycosyltransferase family 2 protein [Candidatus Saccharibacteria bacterium]|nr:glycosyltransferase family 2 protein [Candidatus Saccharibacteria bacterium]
MQNFTLIVKKISSRPRLVLAFLLFTSFIAELIFLLIIGTPSVTTIVNCIIFWFAIILNFLICIKLTNFNIASITSLITTPISLIVCFLYHESYWSLIVPLVLFPCITLIIKIVTFFRYKHINFRKYFIPKTTKKVSVVIPNYNYANYLPARIDSILNQTYPIYELIILDDCSTDDSVSVIKDSIQKIKASRPELKVKFIPNKTNSGNVFKQWEKCFTESQGDFLWICEADDLCSKYFLSAAMLGFEDPEVVLSYTECATIDQNGTLMKPNLRDWIDINHTGHWDHDYIIDGKEELRNYTCVNNAIANVSGAVFRKKPSIPYRQYLHTSQTFRLAGDWYFYTKYLLHGKLAYCSESLNYHRMHSEGVTLTTDDYNHYLEIVRVQDSITNDVHPSPSMVNKMMARRRSLFAFSGTSLKEVYYAKKPLSDILSNVNIPEPTLLSVIVTAYNSEKYIERCIKSIIAALPERSEVIIVDDGSTDSTAKIVKNYAEKYKSIQFFRKKNGGPASAKNYGFRKASGRYIIFADADDEVKINSYQTMLKLALDTNADMVVCDIELVYQSSISHHRVFEYNDNLTIGFMQDDLVASANNKMIKKSIYNQTSLFPPTRKNEDVALIPVLLSLANNIQYIPSSFYIYHQRKGSVQHSDFGISDLIIFDASSIAIEAIKKIRPEDSEEISGIIVYNQIIALLLFIICQIPDSTKRDKIIRGFSKKYRELNLGYNSYIESQNLKRDMKNLTYYIENKRPNEIYSYIKKRERHARLVNRIRAVLNMRPPLTN